MLVERRGGDVTTTTYYFEYVCDDDRTRDADAAVTLDRLPIAAA